MVDLKETTNELIQKVYGSCPDHMLVASVVRAFRQEKAAGHCEALEAEANSELEPIIANLEYEMSDMLHQAIMDDRISPDMAVRENRKVIRLIASGLVHRHLAPILDLPTTTQEGE